MRRKLITRSVLSAPLILALAGCTVPTAHMTPIQALSPAPAIPFRAIYVNVQAAIPEEGAEEAATLSSQLAEALRDLNAVSQVTETNRTEVDRDELLIHVTINDMRKVGGGKRFLLGVLAGSASVNSTVEFFDGATDDCIGTYEVAGETQNNSGSTGTAIALTVQGVVDLLKETYHITSR